MSGYWWCLLWTVLFYQERPKQVTASEISHVQYTGRVIAIVHCFTSAMWYSAWGQCGVLFSSAGLGGYREKPLWSEWDTTCLHSNWFPPRKLWQCFVVGIAAGDHRTGYTPQTPKAVIMGHCWVLIYGILRYRRDLWGYCRELEVLHIKALQGNATYCRASL